MAAKKSPSHRDRGAIEVRANGSLRVKVYAGYDPVTGRRNYLAETLPPGPKAMSEAEKVRTRFLNQVDERRHPKTKATVNQLMDRYLDVVDVDETTLRTYSGYIKNHIRPVLGTLSVARVDGEVLDSFYAQLRRCRSRCAGRKKLTDHRTPRPHDCDARCRSHKCNPMAAASVRQIHWILSGAFDRAVRWKWISVTPTSSAEPPSMPTPDPSPPSAEEAARILNAAWQSSPDWGTFLWLATTTGARRGELCALRRSSRVSATGVLWVSQSVWGTRADMHIKDTKTHQRRSLALDAVTSDLLDALIERQNAEAKRLGIKISDDAYLFSLAADCSEPLVPNAVSRRFERLVNGLGIDTSIKMLRSYNATELLTAGVDLRTVAGRLGHSGGGTTLKFYAAWVDRVSQQAADTMASRMPAVPTSPDGASHVSGAPYLRIAQHFREKIASGALRLGDQLPTIVQLTAEFTVSTGTAQRAVALLQSEGLVDVARGKRAVVAWAGSRS